MDSRDRMRRTFGFTLIELLVVVAIIAVIAAILFPVFAGVRERGRRTVCQSNLKQLALAIQQYAQDNSETYPIAGGWQNGVYPYTKNVEVFRCPSDRDEDFSTEELLLPLGNSVGSPVDYSYNWNRLNMIETFTLPLPPNDFRGTSDALLVNPSTIWLNMDLGFHTADGVDHNRREVMPSCGRLFDGSTQHSGAGNYSYLDGHVKWLTPEEAGEIECANGPLPAPFTN